MGYGAVEFSSEPDVSREVAEDFAAWQALLIKWNAKINLVSRAAIKNFWKRHALDSWQLVSEVPKDARSFIDLGSGGGFPGLALAIACKHTGHGEVTLVESAGKKASFLRTVIRDLSLPASVRSERAEMLDPRPYDVISARAFAPLPELLRYAERFWGEGTTALLLKGQGAGPEIIDAQTNWQFSVAKIPSRSDPDGVLLKLKNLHQIIDIKG